MPTSLRTIVAGVAALDGEDPVLHDGLELSRRLGAALHVVHAYTPPDAALATGGAMADLTGAGAAIVGAPAAATEGMEEGLRARLRDRLRGAPGEVHVEPGSAAAALARVAADVGADVVVVGASHHNRLERALLGSTTERVLRQVHAPVLVLRRPLSPGVARVLLTTDLSDASARACARGTELARALFEGAPLAVRCLHSPVLVPGDVPTGDAEATETAAMDEVRRFLASIPGAGGSVEPVARVGAPAEEIVAEAEEWPADLVVLGTHGRTGLPHLILGSVAESVVRHVHGNALVIPPPAVGPEG